MIDSNFQKGCVLIIGGSGGVGSLCAQEFANSNAKVAITYYKNQQAAIDVANNPVRFSRNYGAMQLGVENTDYFV